MRISDKQIVLFLVFLFVLSVGSSAYQTIHAESLGRRVAVKKIEPAPTPVPVANKVNKKKENRTVGHIVCEVSDGARTIYDYPHYNSDGLVDYFGWTALDHKYLSELIAGEAYDLCYKDMWPYIGSVCLNRLYRSDFENSSSIRGLCLARNQYTCFIDGVATRAPREEHKQAAYHLLQTGSVLPSNVVFQAEFSQGDGVYLHVHNQYFCYVNE